MMGRLISAAIIFFCFVPALLLGSDPSGERTQSRERGSSGFRPLRLGNLRLNPELYSKHLPDCEVVAQAMSRRHREWRISPSDIEEIVWDAYYRLISYYDPARGKFFSYFYGSVLRVLSDERRKRTIFLKGNPFYSLEEGWIASRSPSVPDLADNSMGQSQRHLFWKALGELDRKTPEKKLREIFHYYLNGLSHNEISRLVGKSRPVVTKRVNECLQEIRRLVDQTRRTN